MVNFMELILPSSAAILRSTTIWVAILGGVFLGIYMLIDKIIKNSMKDIDYYKKFVESYKEEADFYKMTSEEYKTMAITYRKKYLESRAKLEFVMKENSSHCKL